MSERALKRILVVVAVLLGAYGLVRLITGGPGSGAADTGELTATLEELDPATVQEVVFVQRNDTVRLHRSGGGSWMVDGHPADSVRIAGLWTALEPGGVDGVVARNPANHARLGVVADSARRLTFRSEGGEATTLLVGGSGPSFNTAYVRLEGSDRVFLLQGSLRTAVRRGADDWRDRTIARVDTGSVARLELARDGSRSVVQRSEDGWTVEGRAADGSAVSDLLGAVARLDASGFAPDSASLEEPDRSLVALSASGDTLLSLRIASGDGSDAWVQRSGQETVYRIPAYRADRIAPEAARLRGEEGDGD